MRQRVLPIQRAKLHQQAFAQVARSHAQRIELLHHRQGFLDVFHRVLSVLRNFLERGAQVTVLIEVADDRFGDLAHHIVANRHAHLPGEMFGETLRRGKKLVKGRPLDGFCFAALRIAAAAVEVLIEKRSDIEILEGTGGLDLGNFFGFRFQEGFVAVVFRGDAFFGQFLQHRVLDHLLIDHLPELETIQRQHAHHLDQARRKDLLLRDP